MTMDDLLEEHLQVSSQISVCLPILCLRKVVHPCVKEYAPARQQFQISVYLNCYESWTRSSASSFFICRRLASDTKRLKVFHTTGDFVKIWVKIGAYICTCVRTVNNEHQTTISLK